MIKGETSKGFSFEVDEDVFDDWELAELLTDSGNLKSMIEAMKKIIGSDGYEKMKEFYRDPSGRIRTTAISGAIQEIMEKVNESKAGKN